MTHPSPLSKKTKASTSITDIEQWTNSFTTYLSVFTDKFPFRSQELLQYLSLIRYAARGHLDHRIFKWQRDVVLFIMRWQGFGKKLGKVKELTRLDFSNIVRRKFPEKVLHDGMALIWATRRLVVDSVTLEGAVVVLVGLKWQHLQRHLDSQPGPLESSVKNTVPVTAKLLWLHERLP